MNEELNYMDIPEFLSERRLGCLGNEVANLNQPMRDSSLGSRDPENSSPLQVVFSILG